MTDLCCLSSSFIHSFVHSVDVRLWTNCTIAIVCKLINALPEVESGLCYSSATPEMVVPNSAALELVQASPTVR